MRKEKEKLGEKHVTQKRLPLMSTRQKYTGTSWWIIIAILCKLTCRIQNYRKMMYSTRVTVLMVK